MGSRSCEALIEGINEANMASETRFGFLSGAAVAYVAMVAHKPLPPEVFCTYHAE